MFGIYKMNLWNEWKVLFKNAVSDSWLLLTDLQHLDIPINRSEPLHCAYTLISKTKDIYISSQFYSHALHNK